MSRIVGDLIDPGWQNSVLRSVFLALMLVALPGSAAASAADDPLPSGLTATEWQEVRHQIEGNTAAIGGPTQEAYQQASNADNSDFFGYNVALDGDTLVVGALGEDSAATGVGGNQADESAPDSGAVYVFVRSGNIWTQQAYLKASNTEAEDFFGISVAIEGDTVVVGATGEASSATGINGNQANNSAPFAGAAYVFVRSGITWTQQAYLKASNTEEYDQFGTDVAIENELIVVGAQGEDGGGGGLGAAYVFARSGNVWSATSYLKPLVAVGAAAFGRSLALDAGTLVVGASGENNTGAAYVFVRSGNTFTQQGYLRAPQPGSSDRFGASVDVYGNTVVVGAPDEDSSSTGVNGPTNEASPGSGAAYVFRRASGVWSFQAFIKASNTQAGDGFGSAVTIYGDKLAIGAHLEDSGDNGVGANPADNSAPNAGATYLFERIGVTWSQLAYVKATNSDTDDQFGFSMILDGTTLAVGANWEDGPPGLQGSLNQSGAVYIFNVPTSFASLSLPLMTDTAVGEFAHLEVSLGTGGLPIAGVSFSLEYDFTCLDPDLDNDDVPDNLSWSVPPDFTVNARRNTANRVDFSIADVAPPIALLSAGPLVEIGMFTTCTAQAPAVFTDTPVVFSPSLPPTFSDDLGQDLENGATSNGTVRIWAGLAGDCNSSTTVSVADLIAVGLEIFDGDGDFWLDSPNSTYIGNPVGCDANRSNQINAADITCANRRLFGQTCSTGLSEILPPFPILEVRSRFEDGTASVTAVLAPNGHPVGSLALSLLLDGSVFDLGAIDQNDDGTPDQLVFPQGAIGLHMIAYEPVGPMSGRLDILLADLSQLPLPQGELVEIGLPALSPPPLGSLRIASSPRPSFGSVIGLDIPGSFVIEGEGVFNDGFESGDLLAWSQVSP